MAPVWVPLRQAMKKRQSKEQPGTIPIHDFVAELQGFGIVLHKNDMGCVVGTFRGNVEKYEMIRFDEFFRTCFVLHKKQTGELE